ncbi:uncharacterized protein [Palaemon carinicauda]|uniref:uncharacterized protein n=1 Tax=Palaemon carinicauda TaxID=392227 RepID=UPI0035B6064C
MADPSPVYRKCARDCNRRLPKASIDPHSICVNCRGKACQLGYRCEECVILSEFEWLEYEKYTRKLERDRDEGLSMGLSDEALLNFIEKKIKDSDERDRRHAEREERALMIKCEENERQRAHELELQKIRGATSNPSHVKVAVDTTRPLPFCDTDDITAYLVRFEKVAVSLNWERNSWSVQLASLLRGKALDIYTSLSDDVTSDYASLKEALLKGFKKTSDWYRTAFKTAKMDSKSTYEQYLNILFRNFDLWINNLRITEDYKDLRNIIVCDQFMSTLPKEMRLFLKERKPRTPEDYSSLGDTYASTHKCYPKDEQKYFRHNANVSNSSDKISASEKPEKKLICHILVRLHVTVVVRVDICQETVLTSYSKRNLNLLEIGQVLDNTGVCGPMVGGTVNGVTVSTILRDTGCNGVVVSEDLIPDPGTNCSYSTLIDYLEPFDLSITHESFLREQQNCEALKYAREMSQSGDVKCCKNGLQYEFVMRNGLLYRKIQKCKKPQLLGKEQVGVPKEILSDRGPQFRSELMLQVRKLLGVKPLFSTPYHPAANGRIERQHQILKSILKKICELKHNQWHRFLPSALFAMREIPSDTTGFSPFEILYGRQVRGPLTILKELWTNSDMSAGETDLYSFVLELREKLSDVSDLDVQNMNISSSTYKSYFDLKSKGKKRLYHINLMKKYYRRENVNMLHVADEDMTGMLNIVHVNKVAVINADEDDYLKIETVDTNQNKPGKTFLQEHNIKIKTTEPFVRKYYPIPAHLTKDFDDEVQSLLDLGIIEQSSFNYSSPALLIKKKEGNYRLVVDFRTLNAITDFDCEPMPSFEQDLHKFADFMYITKLDICKAYHQIPLTPESRKYTAFSTNLGLMQYVRLPFGLSTACATYIRLMRQVLKGLSFVVCYFDNILIVSKDWKIHMADLEKVIL